MADNMDVKTPTLLFLIVLIPGVFAMEINIELDGTIDGYMPWFNITAKTPQKISITWENTGSVSCISRARIDFTNGSSVYTAWGPEDVLKPSNKAEWKIYSYLSADEYNFNITVYHCNEIYRYGPFSVTVKNVTPTKNVIRIINSNANKDRVELFLTSTKDVKNVVVIPESYPLGWVFESGKIDSIKNGEIKSVILNYKPVFWEGRAIRFAAVTEDGSYAEEKPIILHEQKSSYNGLVFILVVVAALMIYLYYKKINFLIWKR